MSEEKINKMELNMTKIQGQINLANEISSRVEKKIDAHISTENSLNDSIQKMIHEFMQDIESKYASKWTEKALIWFMSGVGILLITGFGKLVWEVISIIK